MKPIVHKNKKNGLISIEFRGIKKVNYEKIFNLLNVEELTIYTEHFNIMNEECVSLLDSINKLTENAVHTDLKNTQLILRNLIKRRFMSNILIVDGVFENFDDKILLHNLTNGLLRFFLDINFLENEVHLLINSKCYEAELLERLD
ncbi:MAG: hypothetical protein PHY08_11880 [Candidatus Cloacimonetes bacterium]|nr:hypothetical protein [Candidatus Cloacimonadota bacterium]